LGSQQTQISEKQTDASPGVLGKHLAGHDQESLPTSQSGAKKGVEMQRHLASSFEVAVNCGPEPEVQAANATVTAIATGLSAVARAIAASVKLAAAEVFAADTVIQPITRKNMSAGR
jgi:hypothetical protein